MARWCGVCSHHGIFRLEGEDCTGHIRVVLVLVSSNAIVLRVAVLFAILQPSIANRTSLVR